MTTIDLDALVAQLCNPLRLRVDENALCARAAAALVQLLDRIAALEAERKGLKQDAERWSAVVMLWLMSTELTLTQDEDGRYSITCIEPVEALPAPGRWTGDDPDAAIDAANRRK